MKTSKPNLRTLINTATDPGVLYSVGNAVVAFSASLLSGGVNVGIGALCVGLRLFSESRKADNAPAPSSLFGKLAGNTAASLTTLGTLLTCSAIPAALDANPAQPETLIPAGILAAFGIGTASRGIGQFFKASPRLASGLETFGCIGAATGYMLAAGPTAPPVLQAAIVGIGVSALIQQFNKKAGRWIERVALPDVLQIGVNLGVALTTPSPTMATASLIWAAAVGGLWANRINNGVYETGARLLNKPPKPDIS